MRIWYLGDSLLAPVVEQIAQERGAELIDSSKPNPTMEEVWIEQTADRRMRRFFDECLVIMFLNIRECDSETIVYRITMAVPQAKHIFLVAPNDKDVREGYMHYEGDAFKIIDLEDLNPFTVKAKIEAAL